MRINRKTVTELDYSGYEKYLLYCKVEHVKGTHEVQYIFRFPNNYGAAVTKNQLSHFNKFDLWDVNRIIFTDKDSENYEYIDEKAENFCLDSRVKVILGDIMDLKKAK